MQFILVGGVWLRKECTQIAQFDFRADQECLLPPQIGLGMQAFTHWVLILNNSAFHNFVLITVLITEPID